MKIRKILPLVILALASVFLLSSCDALLDAIFANDTLTVYVQTSWTYGYSPADQVTVQTISGPSTINLTVVPFQQFDGNYSYWQVTIPGLSDGTYTIHVSYSRAGTQSATVSFGGGSSHTQSVLFTY
jgi:hypothetical protein